MSKLPAGSIFSNANPVRRKFEAGRACALADVKRHGAPYAMRLWDRGPAAGDDQDWLAGYRRGIDDATMELALNAD